MRRTKTPLLSLVCLCLMALVAGCGSTTSGGSSGGSTGGSFTLGADATVTIAQGSSRTFTVTPTSADNFTGSVQVSVTGLPTGVTIAPATATVAVGSSTTFTLTAAANAAVGTTNVTVNGASGSLSVSTTVALTVTATTTNPPGSPDFTLTLAPQTLSLTAGGAGQVTLSSAAINGFSGTIAVAVQGLPTGVTVSPATISLTSTNPVTITLTAAEDAPATTTPVQVSFIGTSGSLSHTATLQLTVTATPPPPGSPDFALSVAPQTLSLTAGASGGQVTLSSLALNGFSGTIAVAVQGLPTGVTVSPATISLTSTNPVVITLTAASNAPATTTPVQVSFVGTSGTLPSHTATLQLTVNAAAPTGPAFSITATPNPLTVAQSGQSNPVEIGVTSNNGFAGNVTYTISGLPTGVIAIPSSVTLSSGDIDPVVFEVSANAPIGSTPVTITGTSGVLTSTTTLVLTITAPPPPEFVALALSPTSTTITAGSVGTVSVTATATDGYTGTVNVSAPILPQGVTISPATAALTPGVPQTFTLTAVLTAQPATSTVTFQGQVNSVTGTADLSLTIAPSTSTSLDVPTWHNDMARTGAYTGETQLTPTKVSSGKFGKLGTLPLDGPVDAQPLFVSRLTINSVVHNVLFIATENDTLYALDANTAQPLWTATGLESGETAGDNPQGCSELSSKVGITSTPVIDRNFAPDGAIFFVAMTKDGSGYHQRLHALDLKLGTELSGSPMEITATYPANGGATKTFDPSISVERSALLLSGGSVYLSWAAPCQQTSFDYDGWVMAYSEGTLQQQSALDVTPNGSGGGIWMSAAGPAADANGNVFLATSEGTFDTALNSGAPANSDYGNGFLKIEAPNGVLSVFDYFEPLNGVSDAANYQDQGSGGVMLTPAIASGTQVIPPIAIAAGKDGNIYEMSSSGNLLGEYNGTSNQNYNTLTGALLHGVTSSPAYFNGVFYYGGSSDAVKEFTMNASGATLTSSSANTLSASGATPVISANGTNAAILWALDTGASAGPVLYAYDATNLATQLYSSSTNPSDAVGATGRHAIPLVANGFVYIGTDIGLEIFWVHP